MYDEGWMGIDDTMKEQVAILVYMVMISYSPGIRKIEYAELPCDGVFCYVAG